MLSKRWQYILGFYAIFLLVVFRLVLISTALPAVEVAGQLADVTAQPRGDEADRAVALPQGHKPTFLLSELEDLVRQIVPTNGGAVVSHLSSDRLRSPTLDNLASYLRDFVRWAR